MFISIAGTIGAGKTTLAVQLAKEFNLPVYHEHVDDNPYLADFYADMGSCAFALQVYLLNMRFKQHQQIIWQGNGAVQDRTIYEDTIFAKMLHSRGYITEKDYTTYISLFDNISNLMRKPTLIVWLDVSPKEALERIRSRSRDCESTITLEYLIELQAEYEVFMNHICKTVPVIRVNWEEKHKDVVVLARSLKEKWDELTPIKSI